MKSVYIHIPFCNTICSYCDFCKMFYKEELVNNYLIELKNEISNGYNDELVSTIYIGGGTPSSLNLKQLDKLKEIIDIFKITDNCEITFECNIDSIDNDKLLQLKEIGVNRLSIGVESFNERHLKFLNRKHRWNEITNVIEKSKKIFDNINVDLIYALPTQTMDELKEDIKLFLKLKIPHISTYSLIIEDNTLLKFKEVDSIDSEIDFNMYNYIREELGNNNYIHYEVSNFALNGYQSKHNLVYWNNLEYYGFGLGSSGYMNGIRYNNTRSIVNYLKGNYIKDKQKLSLRDKMEEEMFLGLRKIEGVNCDLFFKKYSKSIEDVFDIKKLLESKKLVKHNGYIKINKDFIYVSNEILINFVGEL